MHASFAKERIVPCIANLILVFVRLCDFDADANAPLSAKDSSNLDYLNLSHWIEGSFIGRCPSIPALLYHCNPHIKQVHYAFPCHARKIHRRSSEEAES